MGGIFIKSLSPKCHHTGVFRLNQQKIILVFSPKPHIPKIIFTILGFNVRLKTGCSPKTPWHPPSARCRCFGSILFYFYTPCLRNQRSLRFSIYLFFRAFRVLRGSFFLCSLCPLWLFFLPIATNRQFAIMVPCRKTTEKFIPSSR